MIATLALGSSVPPTADRLRVALQALSEHPLLELVSQSEIVLTPAAGGATLQRFANAGAIVRTALSPPALLLLLHALEADAGRLRTRPLGPRTLDLDLLQVDDWPPIDGAGLVLPHAGRFRSYTQTVVQQASARARKV